MTTREGKERKRRAKASPPPDERALSLGCLLAFFVYLGVCLVLLALTNRLVFLALALPGLVAVGFGLVRYSYGLGLLAAVRLHWSPRGIRCLLVHSDSPVWEVHVASKWVPRFGNVAVLLNWSERASWRSTLAVRVFRHFCGTSRNFNPAVVVFRGLRQPLVFRYFYAFQEAKSGRPQYLARLESQMFEVLDASS